ncbi:hypothetical protein JL720_1425 [Aureococcus anophagefferens]|nr:hypothetical protein JL720_1425 [Aureococcus anophagefferens]
MPDNGDQVRKIYVSNLDYKTNERDVKRIFERFGAIRRSSCRSTPSSAGPGFCFVTFAEEADAATAIEKMDGRPRGRQLACRGPRSAASAAPAAIERLELAFAPHATTNLVAGERVFVMKSKGRSGQRPFAAAVVGDAAPADDGRVPVVYGDGSSYLVRPANLVRIHRGAGPRTLFCNETREYRLAAKTQVFDGDKVLEIGCDLGATTKALVARGAAVVAVDKARDRLAAAAADVRGATFLACDVLAHPATAAPAPASDVVFVDINGSREYDAVDACSAEAPRRQRPS